MVVLWHLSRRQPAMCYEKWRHLLKKIQETLYIRQWFLGPLQHRHLGTSHSSPNRHQLPRHIFLNLINVWNLVPFKSDFSFGTSQKSQGTESGLLGGWVTWVIWCFTKKLCARRGTWVSVLSWWRCQSPVAHSCGRLNHLDGLREGMFKLNTKFDADSLLYLLILNVMAHSTHAHSVASTTRTDEYSKVIIVHACAFQSTLLDCQVTSMTCKPNSLC